MEIYLRDISHLSVLNYISGISVRDGISAFDEFPVKGIHTRRGTEICPINSYFDGNYCKAIDPTKILPKCEDAYDLERCYKC
jgi:hypothetical protein